MLIDTHAHLHVPEFDNDREEVIRRAWEAGVNFINVGFEPEGNKKAQAIAQTHANTFWTAGIHPHHANQATEENLQWMVLAKKGPLGRGLVALGEMGLDYFKNFQPRETQIEALRAQLSLARELQLSVIMHCRDAFEDTFKILKEEGNSRVVFHCFTGTLAQARVCWERGYLTSFTGICTYPGAENVREVLRAAPAEKIMIETDCPFLPPQGKRGERNEPSFLKETFSSIAKYRDVPEKDLEEQLFLNTKHFFLDFP